MLRSVHAMVVLDGLSQNTERKMINSPPKRRGPGRPFRPGQSGNPGGKIRNPEARRALMDMRQMARGYSEEALDKLVQLMRGVVKVGRQKIDILGQAVTTNRVDEACQSRQPEWSFVDSYWADPDNGLVWRSRQHIHPKGGEIETEVFRPPG